ncbi:MAG TPA: hypothetical protein VGR15_06995 [Bacteroidota bacterium]|jgi:hypothetical protein|nr:hypothetical protein [Bacteroidota bacterium]
MSTYKALEVWTAQTLCDVGILLSIVSFLFHIARPYFDRILNRFTLRVAADFWWVAYVILRDGSLLLALTLGFLSLNLDLMADIKVGLPFVPLGTVALAGALAIKVFRNSEDVNKSFRYSTYLVALAALLNTLGFVFVMEGPGDEYAAASTSFWQTMHSWRSNANPELATFTFYVSISLLAAIVVTTSVSTLRMYGKIVKENEKDAGA